MFRRNNGHAANRPGKGVSGNCSESSRTYYQVRRGRQSSRRGVYECGPSPAFPAYNDTNYRKLILYHIPDTWCMGTKVFGFMRKLQGGRRNNVLILRCCAVLYWCCTLLKLDTPIDFANPLATKLSICGKERARNETKITTTAAFHNASVTYCSCSGGASTKRCIIT